MSDLDKFILWARWCGHWMVPKMIQSFMKFYADNPNTDFNNLPKKQRSY